MNKAAWLELDENARNDLVWSHFPGIGPSSDDWVLSTDGGETGFDFYDTETEAKSAREEYEGYPTYEHATVVHWRHCMDFTTDRNACALVLDEILRMEDIHVLFIHAVRDALETEENKFNDEETCVMHYNILDVLRSDPDTICYCAIKAIGGFDDEA